MTELEGFFSDCCLAPVTKHSSLEWHAADEGPVMDVYLCQKCLKACEPLNPDD